MTCRKAVRQEGNLSTYRPINEVASNKPQHNLILVASCFCRTVTQLEIHAFAALTMSKRYQTIDCSYRDAMTAGYVMERIIDSPSGSLVPNTLVHRGQSEFVWFLFVTKLGSLYI